MAKNRLSTSDAHTQKIFETNGEISRFAPFYYLFFYSNFQGRHFFLDRHIFFNLFYSSNFLNLYFPCIFLKTRATFC